MAVFAVHVLRLLSFNVLIGYFIGAVFWPSWVTVLTQEEIFNAVHVVTQTGRRPKPTERERFNVRRSVLNPKTNRYPAVEVRTRTLEIL